MKKIFVFCGILMALFTGCKEDDTVVPNPENKDKTNFQLITEGNWEVSVGTIVPEISIEFMGNTIVVDEYWDLLAYQNGGVVADCNKDDLMLIKSDSTVVLDEGPTKCDVNDPQTEDGGSWKFLENESKIEFSSFPFDPTGAPQTLDITKLTKDSLHLEMLYTFINPTDMTDSTIHTIRINYSNTK